MTRKTWQTIGLTVALAVLVWGTLFLGALWLTR